MIIIFIVSVRCKNLKNKIIAVASLIAICAVVAALGAQIDKQKTAPAEAQKAAPVQEIASMQMQETKRQPLSTVSKKMVKVPDNKSRVEFLMAFGWEIQNEPEEIADVLVPKNFGNVYTNYNEIQKKQGLDLAKYKGKNVKRYTYIILNYPEHSENIRANMLVYKNKVIGGDICSLEAANGFMHGFVPQSQLYAEKN